MALNGQSQNEIDKNAIEKEPTMKIVSAIFSLLSIMVIVFVTQTTATKPTDLKELHQEVTVQELVSSPMKTAQR